MTLPNSHYPKNICIQDYFLILYQFRFILNLAIIHSVHRKLQQICIVGLDNQLNLCILFLNNYSFR